MEQIKTRPLSRTLLGETQLLIIKGTRDEEWDSGDLRKRQVIIGRQGAPIEESRFIPPPNGSELEEGFSDWEKWINNFRSIPIIVRMALGHYQFETLHPYNNGNGRVGRLVALMQLMEEGILRFPVLDLSSWFDKNRDAYIDNLLRLSETGDFDTWIQFFSKAIEVRSNEITMIANKLIEFRDQTKKKMMEAGFRGVTAFHIIDQLIGYPILDIQSAQKFSGKSFEATNAAVIKLVEAGVLREISGRKRNRIFMCREVMNIVEE
jgi:Fic family protein